MKARNYKSAQLHNRINDLVKDAYAVGISIGVRMRPNKPYVKIKTSMLGTHVERFVRRHFPGAYITSGRYTSNFLKKGKNLFTLALWTD